MQISTNSAGLSGRQQQHPELPIPGWTKLSITLMIPHQPGTIDRGRRMCRNPRRWFQHGQRTSRCRTVQSMWGLYTYCRPRNTWFSPRSSIETTDTPPRHDGSAEHSKQVLLPVFGRASHPPVLRVHLSLTAQLTPRGTQSS